MVALRRPAEPAPPSSQPGHARNLPRALRRRRRQPLHGHRLPRDARPTTSYTLDDGTPVHCEDECVFALPSGNLISRCED
jgi:hypothetical protein